MNASAEGLAQLQLGDVIFEHDDLPEEIGLGGEQMLAVFRFPGGHKEVQFFGVQDRNQAWSGTLNHVNALEKLIVLDRMYRSGAVYDLKVGPLLTRRVMIKKFEWRYRNLYEFAYEIELELAPTQTNLQSIHAAQVDALQPETAAPQQTYTVIAGDCLWSIALRFYGDGSLYRKIATANNIENPDLIDPGDRLVIP